MASKILTPLNVDKIDHKQLVALGARIFVDQLAQLLHTLTPKKGWAPTKVLKAIDAENSRRDFDNTCASHDYCDANVALIFTMRILTGRKQFGGQGGTEYQFDLENDIWDTAKRAGFWNLYKGITDD